MSLTSTPGCLLIVNTNQRLVKYAAVIYSRRNANFASIAKATTTATTMYLGHKAFQWLATTPFAFDPPPPKSSSHPVSCSEWRKQQPELPARDRNGDLNSFFSFWHPSTRPDRSSTETSLHETDTTLYTSRKQNQSTATINRAYFSMTFSLLNRKGKQSSTFLFWVLGETRHPFCSLQSWYKQHRTVLSVRPVKSWYWTLNCSTSSSNPTLGKSSKRAVNTSMALNIFVFEPRDRLASWTQSTGERREVLEGTSVQNTGWTQRVGLNSNIQNHRNFLNRPAKIRLVWSKLQSCCNVIPASIIAHQQSVKFSFCDNYQLSCSVMPKTLWFFI